MGEGDDTRTLRSGMPLMGEWHLTGDEVRAYDHFVRRTLAVWATDSEGRPDPLAAWLHFGDR